jgi:hypothetical protein
MISSGGKAAGDTRAPSEADCVVVAAAPPHRSNETLHWAGFALGTLISLDWLHRFEAEAALAARATIKSGLECGAAHLRSPTVLAQIKSDVVR